MRSSPDFEANRESGNATTVSFEALLGSMSVNSSANCVSSASTDSNRPSRAGHPGELFLVRPAATRRASGSPIRPFLEPTPCFFLAKTPRKAMLSVAIAAACGGLVGTAQAGGSGH